MMLGRTEQNKNICGVLEGELSRPAQKTASGAPYEKAGASKWDSSIATMAMGRWTPPRRLCTRASELLLLLELKET